MGTTKTNMTPTKPKPKGVFAQVRDRIKGKPKKDKKPPEDRFADGIEEVHKYVSDSIAGKDVNTSFLKDEVKKLSDTLCTMKAIKEGDLSNEKGSEKENNLKIAHLDTMAFHLDRSAELADGLDPNDSKLLVEKLYQVRHHIEGVTNEAVAYEGM